MLPQAGEQGGDRGGRREPLRPHAGHVISNGLPSGSWKYSDKASPWSTTSTPRSSCADR
jgi:hypothetical protein